MRINKFLVRRIFAISMQIKRSSGPQFWRLIDFDNLNFDNLELGRYGKHLTTPNPFENSPR